jgi:hypothetical protein
VTRGFWESSSKWKPGGLDSIPAWAPPDTRVARFGAGEKAGKHKFASYNLILDFDLATQTKPILDLPHKYRDRKTDSANACLVRMTELESQCKIWTVDRSVFSVYRRHCRQPVPREFPPEKRLKRGRYLARPALLAPRFLHRDFGEVGRQPVRLKIFDLERNQTLERHAKVHGAI